jgi:hypothetical protein
LVFGATGIAIFSSLSVDDWPDYDVWHEFEMYGMNSKWMQKFGLIRVAILGVGGVILLVLALVKVL